MKPFTALAIAVFSLVSLLQLTRAALGWEVTIHGFSIPLWASAVAGVVSAVLAFMLWRETHLK